MKIHEIKRKITVGFGKTVRQRRRELGLSEEELAWRAKISDRELRNIEHGRANPKADTVISLCVHLNISTDEFYNIYPEEGFDYV
ncbi:MAG: helix-turn-helix transcriptional regulator [Clostridia bacterium]|nr:helix-turn-helix transcriptional regulator [Clostridia bacterium]